MVDWCALPEGVVALIATRLLVIEDFIAFRATCSSWRNGTTLKDFDSVSCPKLPLLMLGNFEEDDDDEDNFMWSDQIFGKHYQSIEEQRKAVEEWRDYTRQSVIEFWRTSPMDEREFTSLSKRKRCKLSIPEANGLECRSSKGWLVMVERKTGIMCLFHPLTRARIPLPSAPPKIVLRFLRCVALSASPSETPDYSIMIAFVEPSYVSGCYVGFWKPGNEIWTRVEIPQVVEDMNYYKGKFYGLTFQGQVWMFDVSGPIPNDKAIKITELPWGIWRPKAQLVECGGRLLIVAPFYYSGNDWPYVDNLEMGELDVINGSYTSITSLGSLTVFLGRSQAFCIDANRFPGILEPNSIYYSDGFYRIAVPGPIHETERTPGICVGLWINL